MLLHPEIDQHPEIAQALSGRKVRTDNPQQKKLREIQQNIQRLHAMSSMRFPHAGAQHRAIDKSLKKFGRGGSEMCGEKWKFGGELTAGSM
eukprot:1460357-Rhodomonas_salina.1